MNLPPPPQGDDAIITQFRPEHGQWELNDENITRIDPKTGETILYNYCKYMDSTPLEVYRYLIEVKGCDNNIQDNNKDTPLHIALRYFKGGDVTVLTYLLSQRGINANIKGNYGYTLLHYACIHINILPLDIFKVLIGTLGADVNAQAKNANTPLHCALNQFEPHDGIIALTYLLSQGDVNVNIKDQSGCTLLHIACQQINKFPLEIFKVLIETHGADVNVQNNSPSTSLRFAIKYFNPNEGGDVTVLTYLLTQKNINVDIKCNSGYTLLHDACEKINALPLDVFKLLIETLGFDVNARDNRDNTPLHHALCNFNLNYGGDITVLTYLLTQKTVNIHIKNNYGYTLFHIACQHINNLPLDVFKLLIQTMGFDVNIQDNNNDTPLHQALGHLNPHNGGDVNVWAYLINQQNLNVNIKDSNGHTLLHLACICDIPDLYDFMDPEDDFTDSEGNLDNHRETKGETFLCQIVEAITERCVQQVLDEATF